MLLNRLNQLGIIGLREFLLMKMKFDSCEFEYAL